MIVKACLKYASRFYENPSADLSELRAELLSLLLADVDLRRLASVGQKMVDDYPAGSETWTDGKLLLSLVKKVSCKVS